MALRIVSLAVAKPPHHVDNDTMLAVLADQMGAPEGELIEQVRTTFEKCGSRARYLTLPEPGYALDLVREAAGAALREAGRSAAEVDLVIYCSVARGWLEPSMAAAVQDAIGARNASCFDVLEACAGWMRALEVADALIAGGRYRNALVLGVEAGMHDYLVAPELLDRIEPEQLAGFTIGEMATATLVERDPAGEFDCRIRSLGEHFDLCMIALPNAAAFLPDDGRAPPPAGRFLSRSDKLFARVIAEMVDMARPRIAEIGMGRIDLFIPHGASTRAGHVVRRALGIPAEKWLCGHEEFGNTVSMSMPTALHHGIATGRVKRGDRVFFLIGSAGISVGNGVIVY